jgi:hypothetical protein
VATYSVVKAKSATLVASTVDTVNFSGGMQIFSILNRSATDVIYFTIDGSTPTVAGDDVYAVSPGDTIVFFPRSVATVKLISSGAAPYTVEQL